MLNLLLHTTPLDEEEEDVEENTVHDLAIPRKFPVALYDCPPTDIIKTWRSIDVDLFA
jgi:hypothetical protein